MAKYIECTYSALVRCKLKSGDVVEFYPFLLNKYTGQPDHTGFTTVTDEQYAKLKEESKVFNAFVKQKYLVVRDQLPASAQTPASLIASKDKMIVELQAKLAAADVRAEGKYTKEDIAKATATGEENGAKKAAKELEALKNKYAALEAETEKLRKKL